MGVILAIPWSRPTHNCRPGLEPGPIRRGPSVRTLVSDTFYNNNCRGVWVPVQAGDDGCVCCWYHHPKRGFAFPRRIAPEVFNFVPPSQFRGRRECRMRAAPAVSCAIVLRKLHMSIQGSGEHPTFPAQWLYGL